MEHGVQNHRLRALYSPLLTPRSITPNWWTYWENHREGEPGCEAFGDGSWLQFECHL